MEPRPRGRGNSCRREATTGNALAFNGAPTSRPGKHGLALLQRAVAIAPSMEPRPRGRGNSSTRAPVSTPQVPLQWSPDLAAGETAHCPFECRSSVNLQWSPDLAAGETTRAGSGSPAPSSSFNGAPTSRPGKREGQVNPGKQGGFLQWSPDLAAGETRDGASWATGTSSPFNGAPTSRPGKRLRLLDRQHRLQRPSMEPRPRGRG